MNLREMNWPLVSLVAFDTETTGKYPLESEICEIAAVKWQDGRIVDEFQTLLQPSRPMSDEVIAIHHITNEMVAGAPRIGEKIGGFVDFIAGSVTVAHHAPFDLGFLAVDIEKAGLPLPATPVFCSSLISRKAIPESGNHRLQTLVKFLGIDPGQAHRALDDARACLEVTLKCLERLGAEKKVSEIVTYQEQDLKWPDYSIRALRGHEVHGRLVEAIEKQTDIQIVYQGGSRKGHPRTVKPIGLVRNGLQDFLVATESGETQPKRYFLEKITKAVF